MKIRFNLIVSEAVADALDSLQEQTGAASKTEVIRMALSVYERLVGDAGKGWTTLQRKDDDEREIVLIGGCRR